MHSNRAIKVSEQRKSGKIEEITLIKQLKQHTHTQHKAKQLHILLELSE